MKLRKITSVMAASALAVLGCAAIMSTSTAGATTTNTSFTAVEDSYTAESNASGTHGTVPLAVNATSTFPDRRWTFVKFTVSGLPAGAVVNSAQLQLYAVTTDPNTFTVNQTASSWSESTLTWANQPAMGSALASRTGITANSYATWTATGYVTGNGTYSFLVSGNNPSYRTFNSRESASNPPTLSVSYTTNPPDVTTTAATSVSSNGATLNGTVNPNNQATTYQFQYGTTTSYGSVAPATPGSAGSGASPVTESAAITGLTGSTTYHYRLTATNATGTSNGPDQTFVTGITPPISGLPTLQFDDEFSGTSVDTAKWNVRNNQHESNDSSIDLSRNVSESGDVLHIQPVHETYTEPGGTTRNYTTGYLDTIGKFSPAPGQHLYFEMRAKLPTKTNASAGMWPAFWLRGSTGTGEIDVMEAWGDLGTGASSGAISDPPEGHYSATIFSDTNTGAGKYNGGWLVSGQDFTGWHTYGWEVDADGSGHAYYDGVKYRDYPVSSFPYLGTNFTGGYNIRLNLQVGQPSYYGDPNASTDFSQQYLLDYVRVWGS
jgi:hypothetical protein